MSAVSLSGDTILKIIEIRKKVKAEIEEELEKRRAKGR